MSDPTKCECFGWAEVNATHHLLGNGHNTHCPMFIQGAGAIQLLTDLIAGIEWWASQEDGVPDELWEAYSRAHFIVRGSFPKERP